LNVFLFFVYFCPPLKELSCIMIVKKSTVRYLIKRTLTWRLSKILTPKI
jgi:hypothetical protein